MDFSKPIPDIAVLQSECMDYDLDDGGADMTGTSGAESGFEGEALDAEEEAVDRECEGLGMCTLDWFTETFLWNSI